MRSKFEETIGNELKIYCSKRRKNKVSYKYEDNSLDYVLYKKYIPDFTLESSTGKEIILEVKGYFRKDDRTKLIAVKENNPDKDIRIIFQRDNKLHSQSKVKYSDWAEKYGFEYAIGGFPERWLKELQ